MRRLVKYPFAMLAAFFSATNVFAQQRFPPPDFENGYKIPATTIPAARALILQYLDVGVLAACLGAALWFIYGRRSRRGLFWLSLFSLGYFGFYRKGCVCPIGSPQNIIYGLFHPSYAVPVTVIAFFALPLLVALTAGRAFCAGVCPQGALQDFFLVKPLKVPAWLEHGLGLLPFIFLGAGLAYAAVGAGFIFCRYDPFVPLFRLSGSFFILSAGAVFLLVGMFVGRPYCRFLCPYGALLKLASLVSKWRVRVTPDVCTQCRLCENSCPYGAMREPANDAAAPVARLERARLGWLLALLPVLIAGGAWAGSLLSPAAAQLHPNVALAELYLRQQKHPVQFGPMTPEALSLARAEQNPASIIAAAADLRRRFNLATALFGGWVGLVFGVKLIALSIRPHRADYEPDRGACFACARCFSSCPNELTRLASRAPGGAPVLADATITTPGGP
jgi:NosR/NirI family nitrous oxide reductase transcriptional regulator